MEKEHNEEYLKRILVKLRSGMQLEESEIQAISVALRKANNITHEPFFEVVYHDEYDRTEHRIMNPVDSSIVAGGDYIIQRDRFEVEFNRCIPKRSEES